MKAEEKEISKYKEQGRGKKKKHQLVPEPEKYHIEEDKMIGSPDMMSDVERRKFIVNSLAFRGILMTLLSVLILPLGALLSAGAVVTIFSRYEFGRIFRNMVESFYRPYMYAILIGTLAVLVIFAFIRFLVYSDKRGLIIRANDKLVEKGLEPVVIPRRDTDKSKLISAFYKIKPPYALTYVVVAIAAALLIFGTVRIVGAALDQKAATLKELNASTELIEKSYHGKAKLKEENVYRFVNSYVYTVNGHVDVGLDLDANGKVLDASHMINYTAKYSYKEVEQLKAKGVLKELRQVHVAARDYAKIFYYPEVTDVPIKFSDYMVNYIDNIREKSSWNKDYEYKAGDHTYITHCEVSYSEGKTKSKDDDKLTVSYGIQQKNFRRKYW